MVEDIIGRGEDRPPGWRPRIGWIAAAVLVAGLIAVEHFPHGATSGPRHPAAHGSVKAGRTDPVRRIQVPGVLPPKDSNGTVGPGTVGPGTVAPWAARARLPRTGARPAWFWPATGRVAAIRGLPEDRNGFAFIRVGGGWAIQPASCAGCHAPPAPVFYLANGARQAVRLGSADLVAPAAAKDRIWLTSYPAGANPARARGMARQYTGTGIAVGPAVPLPAGYRIAEGTGHGLLLVPSNPAGQAVTYRLWNPATGKVLRTFQGVIAVSATEVAYEPPCQLTCPVRVVNVSTGRARMIGLPATNTVLTGSFSPDGRFLALEVSANNNPDGASAMRLEIASLPHGRLAVVPHTNVSSDALNGFGWPEDRDVLVAEFSFVGQVQAVLWSQPAGQLVVAGISPRQDPFGLVIG